MDEKLKNLSNCIGRKVLLSDNKTGTLKFCGYVHFEEGLWCGVELDDDVGDNDGTINNISYFACKKKHGLFLPASEINISGDINLPVNNTRIVSWFTDKSSKNVTKFDFKEFSELIEEFDFSSENFNLDKDSAPDIKDFEECFDSDESLGILPLDLFDENSEDDAILEINKIVTEVNEFQLDQFACVDNNALKMIDNSITSHVSSANCTTDINEFKIDYEKKCTNECIFSSVLDATQMNSLPTSVLHSPKYSSTPKHECNFTFNLDKECLNKVSSQTSSPVFDLNKTIIKGNIIEQIEVAAQSDKPDHIYLLPNRTVYVNTNEKRDSKENIFKITPNILNFLDASASELNKTFNLKENSNALSKISISKEFDDKLDAYVFKEKHIYETKTLNTTYETIPQSTSTLESSEVLTQQIIEQSSDSFVKINLSYQDHKNTSINDLNTTFSISNEFKDKFGAFDLKGEKAVCEIRTLNATYEKIPEFPGTIKSSDVQAQQVNKQSSDSFVKINLSYQDHKNTSSNDLNATFSISNELNDKFGAFDLKGEKAVCETKNLNVTYENIPPLPDTIKSSEVQQISKQTDNAKKSKIAKHICPVPSYSKHPKVNKNLTRKSEQVFKENDVKNVLVKQNVDKGKTLIGMSSNIDDNVVNQSCKSSQVVQSQPKHLITFDSGSLITRPTLSHDSNTSSSYKRSSIKEKSTAKLVQSKKSMLNKQIVPKVSAMKAEDDESYLENQSKQKIEFMVHESKKFISKSTATDTKNSKIPSLKQDLPRYKTNRYSNGEAVYAAGSKEKRFTLSGRIPEKQVLSEKNSDFSYAVKQNMEESSSSSSETCKMLKSEEKIPKQKNLYQRNLR